MNWNELKFWQSGEWQVIEERLDGLEQRKLTYNPSRQNLFRALDLVCPDATRVCILGQDPYPEPAHATGIAFSVPPTVTKLPPTLHNILKEYQEDLHYPAPTSGDLTAWCRQGVLLWNTIPSCEAYQPLSHRHWTEWEFLTKEIINVLDTAEHTVFVCLGNIAASFIPNIDFKSDVILVSHPSPRGVASGRHPFLGSRLFSNINTKLCERKLEPINWRLPHDKSNNRGE